MVHGWCMGGAWVDDVVGWNNCMCILPGLSIGGGLDGDGGEVVGVVS